MSIPYQACCKVLYGFLLLDGLVGVGSWRLDEKGV